jgi:hypothetical protein
MSPRITFKSCGSSSTLKQRNILPTLVILGSLQSLNTSRLAPPFVSQFAGEHRNLLMRRKMRLRETWKRSAAAWRRFYLWHGASSSRSAAATTRRRSFHSPGFSNLARSTATWIESSLEL